MRYPDRQWIKHDSPGNVFPVLHIPGRNHPFSKPGNLGQVATKIIYKVTLTNKSTNTAYLLKFSTYNSVTLYETIRLEFRNLRLHVQGDHLNFLPHLET